MSGRYGNIITEEEWKEKKRTSPERFIQYGPMYQAECDWCGALSDVFDNPKDRDAWMREHRCQVAKVVER